MKGWYISALLLLMFNTSCKKPVLREPEFIGTRNISIDKLGLKTSSLQLEFGFYNPNRLGLTLERFDLDVYLNDDYLGKAKEIGSSIIPATDSFYIPVKMEIGMKTLINQGLSLGLNRTSNVQLKGTARVSLGKKAGIVWELPVDYRTTYRLK
jgi:LEA14-like dessication related protein